MGIAASIVAGLGAQAAIKSSTTKAVSSTTKAVTSSSTTKPAAVVTTTATTKAVSSSTTTTTSKPVTSVIVVSSSSSTTRAADISSEALPIATRVTGAVPSASAAQSLATVSTSSAAPIATQVAGASVGNTILVLARTASDTYTSSSGLNGYGIPFQSILVPQTGIDLPVLNSSATSGNYGGIIIHSEVSYDFGNGNWSSALTPAQWQTLYDYQTYFNVRMIRLDTYPGSSTDTTVVSGGCCGAGVEQQIYFTDITGFPGSGLKTGSDAGVSSQGLYHYPAKITNSTTTQEIAQFGASSDGTFSAPATAGVINTFGSRQQMAFFTSMDTSWNMASNFLQHGWIHWMTRGLFAGRRRTFLNTQIDDVHLITDVYWPNNTQFRIRYQDLDAHIPWMKDINSRLPAGSNYTVELGHNGNGDIENATAQNAGARDCNPTSAIEYDEQIDTPLEFMKTLGSGSDIWPKTPTSYTWSLTCAKLDPLANWFTTPSNRDAYSHISHTFSHMSLNNATYADASKEITFNQAWLNQLTIASATKFSSSGIIPPAITGLHNGDVIRAWNDNGIKHVVGDNTRPVLMNTQNEFWPLTSTVAANGYDGLTIIPRWATTIYYNCDTPQCTFNEWVATSAGSGSFETTQLNDARTTNVRHLLSLHQDPFMFHQANMRNIDMPQFTVGSKTGQFSLLQIWTETIVQEFTRLTTWPVISLTQDNLAADFRNRQARDGCKYGTTNNYSADGKSIVSVTVTATNNQCSSPIPVTFPGDASIPAGVVAYKDKLGSDPLTVWVTLSGSAVTIPLASAVAL